MLRHALRRLLWLGPILLGVSMIVYATLLLVPGDPAVTILLRSEERRVGKEC